MSIVQATVPQANLATAIGTPNTLEAEFSTNVLLPLSGPVVFMRLRRDFLRGLMLVNQFMLFSRTAIGYLDSGQLFNLDFNQPVSGGTRARHTTRYDRVFRRTAERVHRESVSVSPLQPEKNKVVFDLISELSTPNLVFREAHLSGLLEESNHILSKDYRTTRTFSARLQKVLNMLLASRGEHIPAEITPTLREIIEKVFQTAAAKHRAFLADEFAGISQPVEDLLIQWMVAFHLTTGTKKSFFPNEELEPTLGFFSPFTSREWALNRKERLLMEFGTPDLRGPVAAEALPPESTYKRDDYRASGNEMITATAASRRTTTGESRSLAIGDIRRSLDTIYYAGPGSINQLTSQASNSLLNDQRRNTVLSLVREISEAQESLTFHAGMDNTSVTVSRESKGVDRKLSATHHRFKVVTPIKSTIHVYDVGLTWCPRIFNPFLVFRQAVSNAYHTAYTGHLQMYYVPEPLRPHLVWEQYNVVITIPMEGEEVASDTFSRTLASSDREDRPDFNNASVVWNQNESFWRDDPDYWTIELRNLAFVGRTITGRVRAETGDGGADFEGVATITIPILRYSQETVNQLAQYEADLDDYNLKLQALQAQARQYANIKQREFIERHGRSDSISKIVFETLVKRVCAFTFTQHLSYYKEIIMRCIDWSSAKLEFESCPLDSLAYPDFPPDHFMNSLAVRMFMPVIKTAEDNLFDVLTECGSFLTKASVASARTKVSDFRDDLEANGPTKLDEFNSELVIGEHVEGVMSEHDLAQ